MGPLKQLRMRGCGCRQRPAKQAGFVCPISGQASATGMCPISGQTLPGAVKEAKPTEEITKKDPKALMGAESAADLETAAELKEQGKTKFLAQDYEEALQLYSEAVQLTPRDAAVWLNRSICNRNLQNWEDAIEDAEIACELQPDNAKAHYSMALAQKEMGKLGKAITACRAGLKVQSDNKALQQLNQLLKRAIIDEDNLTTAEKPAPKQVVTPPVQETQLPRKAKARLAKQVDRTDLFSIKAGDVNDSDPDYKKDQVKKPKAGKVNNPSDDEESEATQSSEGQEQGEEAVDPNSCPVSRLKENDMEELKEKARLQEYTWAKGAPSLAERETYKQLLTESFREKYADLRAQMKYNASMSTGQYNREQKQGLQLKGGHQPMPRPEHVDLPEDYMKPMGIMSLAQLKVYSCHNPDRRYFISVYGNIFDVSDRPDKYGPDGPYTILVGADITWGLFAGVDTMDYVNRCYDLFKAKDMGKDKIAGVCSWLAWYWTEYGEPVGQLDLYQNEPGLPAPPLQEVDETCTVM